MSKKNKKDFKCWNDIQPIVMQSKIISKRRSLNTISLPKWILQNEKYYFHRCKSRAMFLNTKHGHKQNQFWKLRVNTPRPDLLAKHLQQVIIARL